MTMRLATLAALAALAAPAAATAQEFVETFRADLTPLNTGPAGGTPMGQADISVSDDTLTVRIDMSSTPPGMMHLQHFHGFAEGDGDAICPTPMADTNDDGVIDLIETEAMAGVTMVPFHGDPAGMAIVADTYPVSGEDGAYSYEQSVELSALREAFAEKFPGQELDWERRVIFVHGVPEGTDLPDSAQSLGDVPAHVTLPIACGEIRRF